MEKGKGLIEKYIERVKKLKKDQILIFVLAGVLLLIIAMPIKESGQEGKEQQADTSISSFLAEDDKGNHDSDTKLQEISIQCDQEYVERMEAKLKQLIGDMEEAGRVEVLITLKSSQEKIVEKDIPIVRSNTEETDALYILGGKYGAFSHPLSADIHIHGAKLLPFLHRGSDPLCQLQLILRFPALR